MTIIPDCYYRVSVKALVQDTNGKFLLVKEKIGGKEIRELPGGGLDHGESPREGLVREIMEEMSIEVTSVASKPCYFLTRFENNKWKSNVIYKAELGSLDFVTSDECLEIGFFSVEEARKKNLFPNVEKFIEMYTV